MSQVSSIMGHLPTSACLNGGAGCFAGRKRLGHTLAHMYANALIRWIHVPHEHVAHHVSYLYIMSMQTGAPLHVPAATDSGSWSNTNKTAYTCTQTVSTTKLFESYSSFSGQLQNIQQAKTSSCLCTSSMRVVLACITAALLVHSSVAMRRVRLVMYGSTHYCIHDPHVMA